ncbi:putative F-box/FBD/LRR-repeat protein At1g16940 [Anopheles albimanus]|uniref:putative F-box/FBD/LRR-repeat protein At1g16940 n=1 Tax=Anopheles albimanus TaxID=7167 RepID=UPI00163F6B74|nr:putative F-box/FBD/LRR-repeat protein At1g16940 [Anopheles albimanus]
MASQENYVDLLPNTVLCMVFDWLDLENVKNASLTCKRWNGIIFHSAYIDRFCINFTTIDLQTSVPKGTEKKSLLSKAKELANTDRRYRNFNYVVMGEMENVIAPAWKAIELTQASNLQRLNLYFICSSLTKLLPLVINTIPSMPQLRSLTVSDQVTVRYRAYEHLKQDNIPSIRSKSLQELTMYCKYRYTIDMPELQTFAGALSALLPPDGGDKEPLVLTKLQNLDVTVWSWQPTERSIFRRMPNLVKIRWDTPVHDDLFVAICKTCPHLIEVRFSKGLILSNRSVLKCLPKLAKLRILSFSDIQIEEAVFMDLSKLSHLEELELGHTHLLPISLLSICKSIRKLGLHIHHCNETSLVEIIVRNLPQLTELHLACYSAPISSSVLRALPTLEHLEVLNFSHCQFTQSNFLEMNASMHRLRTLRFIHCKLETKQLRGLQDKFPNLKNTKFEECDIGDEPENGEIRSRNRFMAEIAAGLNVPIVPLTEIYR